MSVLQRDMCSHHHFISVRVLAASLVPGPGPCCCRQRACVRCTCMQSRRSGGPRGVQVILAADVLYDDHLTEAFCTFLEALLRASRAHRAALQCAPHSHPSPRPPHAACGYLCHATGHAGASERAAAMCAACCAPEEPLVLVAAEKRFVFSVDARDVRAPAFEHFLRCVDVAAEPGANDCGGATAAGAGAGCSLRGRFVDVGSVPRAFGGGGRVGGEHLVLLQLWLAD